MSRIFVVVCGSNGACVSVYDLMLCRLCAIAFVMSIIVVRIVCSYSWVMIVFRVSCMRFASCQVSTLEFAMR